MENTYLEYPLSTPIKITNLISFLFYDTAKDYVFYGERHDFWELVFVDQGNIFIKRETDEYMLKKGDLVIYPPNEFHGIRGDGMSSARFLVITFKSSCKDLLVLGVRCHKVDKEQDYLLKQLYIYGHDAFMSCGVIDGIMRLEKREEQSYGAEQYVKLYLEALLISLIRKEYAIQSSKEKQNQVTPQRFLEVNIREVKAYIDNHLSKQMTLDHIEKGTGISKRKIQYLIKEAYNMTVSQYIRYLRIERAKILLRKGTYTITEIAESVGYSSIHYFSSQFKKVSGVTPSAYGKSLKVEGHGLTFDKK